MEKSKPSVGTEKTSLFIKDVNPKERLMCPLTLHIMSSFTNKIDDVIENVVLNFCYHQLSLLLTFRT